MPKKLSELLYSFQKNPPNPGQELLGYDLKTIYDKNISFYKPLIKNSNLLDDPTILNPIKKIYIVVDNNGKYPGGGGGGGNTPSPVVDYYMYSTGNNRYGQLGLGHNNDVSSFTIVNRKKWKQISCGSSHTLAIDADGYLYGTGSNVWGQLGNGTNVDTNVFIKLGTDKWKSISCGENHSVGIKEDGTLWGTGGNNNGQLGMSPESIYQVNEFFQMDSTSNAWKLIECGFHNTFAINDTGLFATGRNNYGELGLGNTINQYQLTQVVYLYNQFGQQEIDLRNNVFNLFTIDSSYDLAVLKYGNSAFISGWFFIESNINYFTRDYFDLIINNMASGYRYDTITSNNGNFYITGYNDYGVYGSGDTITIRDPNNHFVRQKVTKIIDINGNLIDINNNILKFDKVKSGRNFIISVDQNGIIYGAGDNSSYQLGLPNAGNVLYYTQIDRNKWYNIYCGENHTFGLRYEV